MSLPGKVILVVGSSNTDMILRVPSIPRPGETVIGGDFAMAAGGKGANQAVAASRAGGRVSLVARVGDDLFGERALEGIKADGIDTRFVFPSEGMPSGIALIHVDDRGENSISVASGANARLTPEDLDKADDAFAAADVVLLQLEIPLETVEAAARRAWLGGVPVILNPAPARLISDALLAHTAYLTPNAHEAECLSGVPVRDERDVKAAAARLRARGAERVVVTLGERGIYALTAEFEGFVSSFRVKAVDSTAAGDVFNGALAVALAEERPLREALRFAQAGAALSVTRSGAQPSAPTRAEIEGFLSAFS